MSERPASGHADAFRRAVVDAADATGTRPLWRALGKLGVLDGLYDAAEVDTERLDVLLTELDARQPLGTVLAVCVQVASAIPLLRSAAHVSPLARTVAAEAQRGEAVLALAATDAAASGSALMNMGTRARIDDDGVTISGGKDWIANGGACDYALVLARHRPARHFTSFCWTLVPARNPGVRRERATTRHFAGADVAHLRFADVRLDRAHVIGRPGRALAEFARHIGAERLAGALWARALCRRVLRDTHRYLSERPADGGSLWHNQAVRERFARCLVEWSRLDAMCAAHTATAHTGGTSAITEGMVLKAAYAQSADRILGECADLRGAEAFSDGPFGDGGLVGLRAQAAMFGIAGGATGAMLAAIADNAADLLGAGARGEAEVPWQRSG
ncbi:acyl-CoA dehydrogenase family protein [Actinomadura syzygii]|uniref:acyl-CoA dehydrogenase family protein n=1 Tax=Actinomadura syzygii TaxID=1427538 RepID=UPI001CA36BEF|nr:acyl-CoA dehydrogenase family protein [Actinomadura syzygii]